MWMMLLCWVKTKRPASGSTAPFGCWCPDMASAASVEAKSHRRRVAASRHRTHPIQGVTSLRLMFDEDTPAAAAGLARFMELVGSTLVRLWLGLPRAEGRYAVSALRSCPNLKTLVVHGAAIDTEAFLEAYDECNARVEELDCTFSDFSRLATELADMRTRLAQTLRRFGYRWSSNRNRRMEDVFKILVDNRRLEYFDLTVPCRVYEQNAKRVAGYHNQSLPVAREPFPLPCRLAFLSVFSSRRSVQARGEKHAKLPPTSTAPATPARSQLQMDRHVVALIFRFAAERVHRRVSFMFEQRFSHQYPIG